MVRMELFGVNYLCLKKRRNAKGPARKQAKSLDSLIVQISYSNFKTKTDFDQREKQK